MILTTIIYIWTAILISVYTHEIGHLPNKIKFTSLFPIPNAIGIGARSRYGGITINILTAFIIFKINPTNLFLQILGLTTFLHATLYLILGSFNKELPLSTTKDDIPNKQWKTALLVAGILTYFLGPHYLNTLQKIFT